MKMNEFKKKAEELLDKETLMKPCTHAALVDHWGAALRDQAAKTMEEAALLVEDKAGLYWSDGAEKISTILSLTAKQLRARAKEIRKGIT